MDKETRERGGQSLMAPSGTEGCVEGTGRRSGRQCHRRCVSPRVRAFEEWYLRRKKKRNVPFTAPRRHDDDGVAPLVRADR